MTKDSQVVLMDLSKIPVTLNHDILIGYDSNSLKLIYFIL